MGFQHVHGRDSSWDNAININRLELSLRDCSSFFIFFFNDEKELKVKP